MARGNKVKGSAKVKRQHIGRKQELRECKICGEQYDLEEDFLKHIRYNHKLSQAAYFQEHHPRYDKHTGEIIKFKSRDFYFDNDFNDKASLKAWLTKEDLDTQRAWCREALLKRREEKGLIYTPTQLELFTVMIPAVSYLDALFDDYYGLCKELGFKSKYKKLEGDFPFYPLSADEHRVQIDTREQKPLIFEKFETFTLKLDEGDYALEDEEASAGTRIERKSVPDFFGTLSKMGHERFVREIDRALSKKLKFIVLVEGSISDVYQIPNSPKYKNMRVSPEYILHQMRDLIVEYPTIQFLFVKNRGESVKIVEKLLQSKGEWNNYDLQLLYDTKKLI